MSFHKVQIRESILAEGPDFIGIGTRRAGTTWLSRCLQFHPQIYLPLKEVHFFDRPENWGRGTAWYEGLFRARGSRKCGEFTPHYLPHPQAADRIASVYPGTRLICCLRNPIDCIVSQYYVDLMYGAIPKRCTLEQAMAIHPEYVQNGMYASHLARFLACFSRERLLLLFFDDLLEDARAFLRKIYGFIGVDESFDCPIIDERINASARTRFPVLEIAMTRAVYALQRRGWGKWVERLRQTGLPAALRRANVEQDKRPLLSMDDRKRLYQERFAVEIDKLEQLTGRSLSAWKE